MKRKSIIALLVCTILGSVCLAGAVASADVQQKALSEKIIRLHVIANSDADEDQCIKLQVRDAVLNFLEEQSWEDRKQAEDWIALHLDELEQCAEQTLMTLGTDQSVQVELGVESYPTRCYETFSLPAGEYLSLRIVLGGGEGKNWWCVVYPSLCFTAVSEFEEIAVSAGFQDDEIRFITEEGSRFKLEFKLLEFFHEIRRFLQGT